MYRNLQQVAGIHESQFYCYNLFSISNEYLALNYMKTTVTSEYVYWQTLNQERKSILHTS